MKEYIEREAVLRIIDKYGCGNGSVLGYHSGAVDCAGSEIETIPAADVIEADRLGRVGRLMLPNKGCPRGPMGRLGMAGGKTQDKKAILIEELCCMDTFEDVDGNVWRPVQEEVLQEVIEILCKEADTLC